MEAAGDLAGSVDRLRQACARFPHEEAVHAAYARGLGRTGEVDAALTQARRWPNSPWAAKLGLKLLIRQGRFDEAAAFEAAVAAADPADPNLLDLRAMRARQDPDALLRLSDQALAHEIGATHALYLKAVALAQLGRGEAAAALMGIEDYMRVVPLHPPAGFADMSAFLGAVRGEILGNPTLHPDPAGHATSKGLRTRSFPLGGDVAATALAGAMRDAIAAYADELSGDHPFVRARPDRATFTPWALVFRTLGRQLLHHHPEAWLTGVFYVSAPEGPTAPGALRIGGLPAWAGVKPPWPVPDVAPTPGTLVMFPSFVPHETVPTGSEEERISVAFDVRCLPSGPAG